MKLIVGLGNPDKKFFMHRHNIGYIILDSLNYSKKKIIIRTKNRSLVAKLNNDTIFFKPYDWMNSSGISIKEIKNALNIENKNILIIHDDMDFDFGVLKIKGGGNSGGHNGLKSIIENIGKDFNRLRIGVGRPINQIAYDYVLSDFNAEEQKKLLSLGEYANKIIKSFIDLGAQKTMQAFNRSSFNV